MLPVLVVVYLLLDVNITSPIQLESKPKHPTTACAPWMPLEKRKVLFIRVSTWEVYYTEGSSKSGEEYVYAALDWALLQNDFYVVHSDREVAEHSLSELRQYHRIFLNGHEWHKKWSNHPEILCKVRALNFWGNLIFKPQNQYDQRQSLTPYPDEMSTFVGFFVHSMINNPPSPNPDREKHGLILGKKCDLFKPNNVQDMIQALLDNGFKLYSAAKDSEDCKLPDGVNRLHFMPPEEYAELLSTMAFLIGVKDPIVSPSPLVGMAHGAAWINPIYAKNESQKADTVQALQEVPLIWHHPRMIHTQHWPLSLLGMPYVYNVDLDDTVQVVQAAEWAVKYRFSSYTPPEFRPEAMVARSCAIMEDDALCLCPNHPFGKFEGKVTNVKGLNCHANPNVRNGAASLHDDGVVI